jgi:hypothetical protein
MTTYLVVEFLFFKPLLVFLPLKLHAALPTGLRPLAQSSKQETIPERYLALLGDSYAQGAGDWLLSVNPNTNPPFHSAHLLRDHTGKDVLSFGASGAGSLRALATEPEVEIPYLQRTWLYRVPLPDRFVAYFYEGNDLNDNVEDLLLRFFPNYDASRLRDPDYFRRFIEDVVLGENKVELERRAFEPWDNLFLFRTAYRIAKATITGERPPTAKADWRPGAVNRALVAGSEVALPDGLQSPSLDLTDEEIAEGIVVLDHALRFLRERYPNVPVAVIYVPAPLSCYSLTSPRVSIQVQSRGDRATIYDRSLVESRSDAICESVERISERAGASFADARPSIRAAATKVPVHGPRDWKHLNRRGQEALTDAVMGVLNSPEARTSTPRCSRRIQ